MSSFPVKGCPGTVTGKGYAVLLRLYGPLEPWFDKTWRPGDFVRVD